MCRMMSLCFLQFLVSSPCYDYIYESTLPSNAISIVSVKWGCQATLHFFLLEKYPFIANFVDMSCLNVFPFPFPIVRVLGFLPFSALVSILQDVLGGTLGSWRGLLGWFFLGAELREFGPEGLSVTFRGKKWVYWVLLRNTCISNFGSIIWTNVSKWCFAIILMLRLILAD